MPRLIKKANSTLRIANSISRQPLAISHLPFAKIAISAAMFFAVFLFFAQQIMAGELNLGLGEVEREIALPTASLTLVIVRIINIALGFLGIIVVLIILYGGYIWMISGGDERKVETAKKIIRNGAIGLIIIILSFAITRFIVGRLEEAALGPGPSGARGRLGPPIERLSGALGTGPIEMHYPGRGATGIARNTNIMLTFKNAIDQASVTGENFLVSRSSERNGPYVSGAFRFSEDGRTVVFDPADLLGSSTDNIFYTVRLIGGSNGIRGREGEPIFSSLFGDGYLWEFQTGMFIDAVPPRIISVTPSSGAQARNILVQVTWDEAMDPTSVSGLTSLADGIVAGFRNILVRAGGVIVPGSWEVANEYRTAEFQTTDLCGANSCGGNVYCLPADSEIVTAILAATLGAEPPASAGFPYDGVVDAVGNSMDGGGDGRADGQPADNYVWDFRTSNLIDLRPPRLERLSPGIDEGGIAVDRPIEITFSKIMSARSLNNENVTLVSEPAYEYWYWVGSELVDKNGQVATSSPPVATRAVINHGIFAASDDVTRYDYFPGVLSGAKDILQNCFYPGAGPQSGSDAAGGVCAVSGDQPYCCNGVPSAERCRFLPRP